MLIAPKRKSLIQVIDKENTSGRKGLGEGWGGGGGADKLSLAGAATSIIFCRDKTPLLSLQKYACLSRQMFVFFRDETFATTSILLSRQKTCLCDKTFVATKMILVAVPANDRE